MRHSEKLSNLNPLAVAALSAKPQSTTRKKRAPRGANEPVGQMRQENLRPLLPSAVLEQALPPMKLQDAAHAAKLRKKRKSPNRRKSKLRRGEVSSQDPRKRKLPQAAPLFLTVSSYRGDYLKRMTSIHRCTGAQTKVSQFMIRKKYSSALIENDGPAKALEAEAAEADAEGSLAPSEPEASAV